MLTELTQSPQPTPAQLSVRDIEATIRQILDALTSGGDAAVELTWGNQPTDHDGTPNGERKNRHGATPHEVVAELGNKAIRCSTLSNLLLLIRGLVGASASGQITDWQAYQISHACLAALPGLSTSAVIPAGWNYQTNEDGTVTITKL